MNHCWVRKPVPVRDWQPPFLRGFSLIELIVIMIILSLMASVAVPRVANTLARRRVEFAAARIVSDLRLAQREARVASQGRTVSFDTSTNAYTLLAVADLDHPTEYVVRLADPPYEVKLVSANLGDDAQIKFDGYGVPDTGGTVVISARTNRITITVDAASGRASTQYALGTVQEVTELESGPVAE